MVAKLTVVFFIICLLLAGILLIFLPWFDLGAFGDWKSNYLLRFTSETLNLPGLREAVASNWFRGAITGLGVLNIFLAFWEIAHFKEEVKEFEIQEIPRKVPTENKLPETTGQAANETE